MSSNISNEEHDPVANLTMLPARSILKTSHSIDDNRLVAAGIPTTGMKRSESKSHKIPHFDEMNIIATYHPADKDYGHMKIEEPKTPYIPSDEMDVDSQNDQMLASGVDPHTLSHRLNESSPPRASTDRSPQRVTSADPIQSGTRAQFEHQRKEHYNEFEIVRLHKKQIEAELRALEQEEATGTGNASTIKPILIHSSSSHHPLHHFHVSDGDQQERDEQSLTPEERERRKQFEMKRKQHYNEFQVAHSANKSNDDDDDDDG